MDRRLQSPAPPVDSAGWRGERVTLAFEGDPVRAYASESLAVALFASGVRVLSRSIKYHRPRSFFCLAGHCGACLMRVDGVPNVRACRAPAREGVSCERQNAYPSASHDALGAIDWMFPNGFDHHTLMTGSRTLNRTMQAVVQKLAGLGELPDRGLDHAPPEPVRATPDALVVGGGPAGLAAATALARAGHRTLLVDEDGELGGSLLSDPRHGLPAARARARAAREAGVELWSSSSVIGFYPEDEAGLIAVARPDRLALVTARCTVYATGGYETNAPFPDNDRPGIFAGRAVGTLVVRHGIRPAEAAVVLGRGPYAAALAEALRASGAGVAELDGERETILAVKGRSWVRAVDVGPPGGEPARRIPCDLVAVATTPAPAFELARQHGAAIVLDAGRGGFAVQVDSGGRSTRAGVWACGDLCGYLGPDAAGAHGERVGTAAAAAISRRDV